MNPRLKDQVDVSNAAIEVVASEAQDIAHLSADYQRASGHRKEALRLTLTERLDDLLYTMLDAFRGSIDASEAEDLLKEHHPLTERRLASLPAKAVPLVVVRELVSVHLVPMDRARLANWNPFAERYRNAIV